MLQTFSYYCIFSYLGTRATKGGGLLQENTRSTLTPGEFEDLVFDTLERDKTLYAPLEIRGVQRRYSSDKTVPNGTVRIAWQGKEIEFQVEVKSRTAPKIVQEAFWKLRSWPLERRKSFLLVVPYLSETIREMVEIERVNCLDLNGNYFIQNPELLAIRLDRKNRFPESTPIKKVFSGNSALVGRLLLREKRIFTSVSELFKAINTDSGDSGAQLSLSAISKILSKMVDELIIEKTTNRIALIQPEKLLNCLQEGYNQPKALNLLKLKIPGTPDEVLKTISKALNQNTWMVSGESSANRYAVTTPATILRIYSLKTRTTPDLTQYEDSRFFNVVIEKKTDAPLFFDRVTSSRESNSKNSSKNSNDQTYWASRLQTYLELSKLDKREREIAETIRADILKAH